MEAVFYRVRRDFLVFAEAVEANGTSRPLNPRLDLANHSPSGFEFGYGGSGPSQLALAILADLFGTDGKPTREGDARALRLYQPFKWAFVAGAEGDAFEVGRSEILDWLEAVEPKAGGREGA